MRLAAFYSIENEYEGTTVNFGGAYLYDIKLKGNQLKVYRNENKSFIGDFYGKNISLVNAIVGKNGAGKTTLLKTILQSEKLILIFENDDQTANSTWLIASSKNYSNKTIGITSLATDPEDRKKLELDLSELDKANHYGYNIYTQISYNPTFYYYSPLSNYNLSTKYLDDFSIKEDSVIFLRKEILQRQIKLLIDKHTIEALRYIYEDFPVYSSVRFKYEENINPSVEEIDFRFYTFYKNNDFQLSDKLSTADKDKRFLEAYSKDLKSGSYNDLLNKVLQISKKFNNRERFYYEIYIRFLIISYTLVGFSKLNSINNKIYKLLIHLKKDKIETDKNFNKLIEETIEIMVSESGKSYEDAINQEFKHFQSVIESMFKFMPEDQVFRTLDGGLSEFYNLYFGFIFRFEFHAKDFLPNYTTPFIIFETDHALSQGEEYLLNLFADIYSNSEIANKKNIVLFLDEPDLGFHPKWKKKLVQSLIKALPVLINNISPKDLDPESFDKESIKSDQSIQIIFTTHNPLTLSDIPNYNVIYLDKKNNSTRILNPKEANRPKYTFATNINELIMHSFYIDNGLMGDFAKEKIEEVIIKLNILELISEINLLYKDETVQKRSDIFKSRILKNITDFLDNNQLEYNISTLETALRIEKDDIFKIISIIGEPIIKYKLLEMCKSIFDEDKKLIAQLRIEEIAREAGININIEK